MAADDNRETSTDTGRASAQGLPDPVSGPSVLEAREVRVGTRAQDFHELDLALAVLEGEVSPKARTAAVVLAGGTGERFGVKGGKQLFELLGRPAVTWALEAFDATSDVGQIVLVCPEDDYERMCRDALDPYPFVTPVVFAPAGQLRQESAFSGVNAVDPAFDLIAMHDGARPLITPGLVTHVINVLKGSPEAAGAVVGYPSIDTLKVVRDNQVVTTPERSAFWAVQTPQVFRAGLLLHAHCAALEDGFVGTDDSSLIERLGYRVLLVEGPRDNIKLTVPEDVGPVESVLRARRGIGRSS